MLGTEGKKQRASIVEGGLYLRRQVSTHLAWGAGGALLSLSLSLSLILSLMGMFVPGVPSGDGAAVTCSVTVRTTLAAVPLSARSVPGVGGESTKGVRVGGGGGTRGWGQRRRKVTRLRAVPCPPRRPLSRSRVPSGPLCRERG